ncbi:Calcium and integrin-binding protein 1, partial [Pseudolycoriella hygida]
MGGSNSILSEEQLDEYVELTYLTKSEIVYILQKFIKIQNELRIPNDLTYRHDIIDILNEFPQYKYNPFRDRIFYVFSSRKDGRISFEDFLDLSSAMSLNCPLKVKAAWAFKVFDFDDDNDITKYDLMDVIDRLTYGSDRAELSMDEKNQICDILLQEIDLEHSGGMNHLEFIHAITKMPEFATTFSCRL